MSYQNPLISIITVNFNGLNFLRKFISSVKKQSYKYVELIIVDNNSTDGSIAFLANQNIVTKIIRNKSNNGFAKGNNQGAKSAKGNFLFFLNNDTELFPDTLEQLIKCYKSQSILTAFQIPSRNKKLQGRAGAGMDIFGYSFSEQNNNRKTKLFYADGAALFIGRKDFIKIGMFDEKLFMFQEDVDLSWKAQIFGFNIVRCWNAKLFHYYGGTAKLDINEARQYVSSYFRRYLNERNVIRNILKNYSFPLVFLILVFLLFFHFFEIIFFLIIGNIKVIECYLAAYWWNIKNIRQTMKIRILVQSKRTVSDWNLLKKMYWSYSKLFMVLKIGIPKFN